jgi:hypothetical protein
MLLGAGPGILLVNRPDTFLGIPLVYAWAICWYLVQVAVAFIAYFALWSSEPGDEGDGTAARRAEGDRH